MRFVDKESSLLKTALTGKTRRFVRTALFFKCLNRVALKFKRYAYKQSSQKKDFFGALGDVDNLLTGGLAFADSIAILPGKDGAFTRLKGLGDRKFALFAPILAQPYGCFSAWRRLGKENVCALGHLGHYPGCCLIQSGS